MTDLTVQELYDKLGDLIEKGFGDNEIRIRYDSDTVYTTLPKSLDPVIGFDYVEFSDYRGVRTNKELEAAKKIAEQSRDIPYGYYTDPKFKDPFEEERKNALNCTDSRVEELKNRAKQRLIIRELLEK